MSDIPNMILDDGGTNQVTVYTESVEEILTKMLVIIKPPQSTANKASGPKDNKIVDLQRVEERFSVDGLIDETDKNKVKAILKAGGVSTLTWDGESFIVNYDKIAVLRNKTEDDHRGIKFTCIVGVDIWAHKKFM